MKNIEDNLRKNNDIKMTEEEKNLVFQNILKFMDNYAPSVLDDKFRSHKSPYWAQVFKITGVVFASFVIFFAGGGVSYEASTALPGDLLYSFKVNTIEEVRGAFIKSPEEKLLYNQSRVAKRIEEVKTLAESGKLTIAKGVEIEKALDSHITEIENAAKELKENDPETFKTTTETITPIMEQHKNELKEVSEKSSVKAVDTETDTKDTKKDLATKDVVVIDQGVAVAKTEAKNLKNDTESTKEKTLIESLAVLEKKKEDSKKAVDSIIAKIEKETDSIKAITKDEPAKVKSDSIQNTKATEIKEPKLDKEAITEAKDATQ